MDGILTTGKVAAARTERRSGTNHPRNPGRVVAPTVGRRTQRDVAPALPDRFAGIRTKETIRAANPRAPEPWTGRGIPRGRDNDAEKQRLQRR